MIIAKAYNHNIIPLFRNKGDGAYDLPAAIEGGLTLHQQAIVPTGWTVMIPDGMVGIIKPRSGLAAKWGIQVGAGVIDSGYRGEVKVVLYRTETGTENDNQVFRFETSDRIAQMVVVPHYSGEVFIADELPRSNRGNKGFGSSGLKIVKGFVQ